jgi:toxin ParE1/3/4
MRRIRLSADAVADIERLLARSAAAFGPQARERYERLLAAALEDIAADPERAASKARDDLRPGLRSYHLAFARKQARGRGRTVARPRHFVLYRIAGVRVDIVRVLHDAMDLAEHVPEGDSDE